MFYSCACRCRNEKRMCYLISACQSLIALPKFRFEARRVLGGPMMDAFKTVLMAFEEGNEDEIFRAIKYLRARGGQDMDKMFMAYDKDQDSEEWVSTFLSTVQKQIKTLQPALRIAQPFNFVQRHFQSTFATESMCAG
jgi:hypothetical protein